MRENQSKIAFLFGVDDHWGPQELYEEVTMNSSIFFFFSFFKDHFIMWKASYAFHVFSTLIYK